MSGPLYRYLHSREPGLDLVLGRATIAGTGAITASAWPENKGLDPTTPFTRVSAGLYTVALELPRDRIVAWGVGFQNATGIPAVTSVGLTSTTDPTSKVIQFQCSGPTNSSTTTLIATDPASGDTMYVWFLLASEVV